MPYRTPEYKRSPGGTPGGSGQFLIGLVMLIAGSYLFLDNVVVSSYGWGGFFSRGQGAFGLSLVPLFAGIAFLFFSAQSKVGWFLTATGTIIIFAGIISRLDIHFRSLSLFNVLVILVLVAGGLGLIARSLRAQ